MGHIPNCAACIMEVVKLVTEMHIAPPDLVQSGGLGKVLTREWACNGKCDCNVNLEQFHASLSSSSSVGAKWEEGWRASSHFGVISMQSCSVTEEGQCDGVVAAVVVVVGRLDFGVLFYL